MCLILFAYNHHPKYRLVLAANRDEFYDRPAAPLGYWDEYPHILAGRDLQAGGTWLGICVDGRWAAVTNYRDPRHTKREAPSRGDLVSDYLKNDCSARDYLENLRCKADHYNGFNLLAADGSELAYFGNRGDGGVILTPGLYGLSNSLLDTPWPKVQKGKKGLDRMLAANAALPPETVLPLLKDPAAAPDDRLPDTGVGLEWERRLSPLFIASPFYGTRCSSILTITHGGKVAFSEYTWEKNSPHPVAVVQRDFHFSIRDFA